MVSTVRIVRWVFSGFGIESREDLIALIAEENKPVWMLSREVSMINTNVGYLIDE